MARQLLSETRLLRWAERHRACTGQWPTVQSGCVLSAPSENWRRVDNALRYGLRGLPGGSSLALFLALHRNARNKTNLPRLTVRRILSWADDHYQRTGGWPNEESGPVTGSPGETWGALNRALQDGHRGLTGGTSLARLLARCRQARNHTNIPRLTVEQVLVWADGHRRRSRRWPQHRSGPIREAPGETWAGVNTALQRGLRGLPGASSLYRLLKEHRQIPGPRPPVRRSHVSSARGCSVRLQFPAWVLEQYRSGELDSWGVARLCQVCHKVALRELRRAGMTIRPRGRPQGKRPALHATVVRRYRRGQSLATIAHNLGLTRGRVGTILRRYGVAPRPAGPDLVRHDLSPADRRHLACRLRERRQALGLTQEQLAARVRVTPETISALETARRCPTRRTLTRIAKVLNILPAALLP